jgi:hypothetical protein
MLFFDFRSVEARDLTGAEAEGQTGTIQLVLCSAPDVFALAALDVWSAIPELVRGGIEMNLVIWLPTMFLLGLAGLGLCYAFLLACEGI